MKTTLLIVLAILTGIAIGVGAAVLRVRMTPWESKLDAGGSTAVVPTPVGTTPVGTTPVVPTAVTSPSGERAPKVVVDQPGHDFGTIDQTMGASHDFVFSNVGDAPLTLEFRENNASRGLVTAKLERDEIPPGESANVTLTWVPATQPGPAQDMVKILTNDPDQPQVMLTVSGLAANTIRFVPPSLNLGRLAADVTTTGQSRLLCCLKEPLEIENHRWSEAATADFFNVVAEPLSEDELKRFSSAAAGLLITVTIKPGMPPGSFQQNLVVQLADPVSATKSLPIQGIVGNEIGIAGRGWDPETGILYLGVIARREGLERRVLLLVRGPLRKEIDFTPVHAPSMVKVSLGQRSEINNGAVVQIPLTISIPPGSPPTNRLGSQQGDMGEIILETTHPRVPKLRILLSFAIQG